MNSYALEMLIKAKDLASGEMSKVNQSLDKMKDKIEDTKDKTNHFGDIMKTAFAGGALALAGGLAVAMKKGVDSASAMETQMVSLTTALGGNKDEAEKASKQIIDFAKKTPYELAEVQDAYIKLKNYGINPSEEALTSFGDTASAMGKPLSQMIEAVADASSGEFERLKEFGIKSKKEGENITFTFKGMTTTVKNDSKSIEEYLVKLGQTNFAGGMEAQSKTLSGTLTNMFDSINLTLGKFAEQLGITDKIKELAGSITKFVESIDLEKLKGFSKETEGMFNLPKIIEYLQYFQIEAEKAFKYVLDTVIMPIWTRISTEILPQILPIIFQIIEIFKSLQPVLQPIFAWFWDTIMNITTVVIDMTVSVIRIFRGFLNVIEGILKGDFGKIREGFKDIFFGIGDFIGGVFKGIFRNIANQINAGIRIVNNLTRNIPAIPGVGKIPQIPEIPKFARGGMINTNGDVMVGENGPEILQGLAGRRVINNETSQAMLSGDIQPIQNINIQIDLKSLIKPSLDELNEMGRVIVQALKRQGVNI